MLRTILSCMFMTFLFLLGIGSDGIRDDPASLIFICSIFVIYNVCELPNESKVVKRVEISQNDIKIINGRNEAFNFSPIDISMMERVEREHGFRGHQVEQLLITVRMKEKFYIPANTRNFCRMCRQLGIQNFNDLESAK